MADHNEADRSVRNDGRRSRPPVEPAHLAEELARVQHRSGRRSEAVAGRVALPRAVFAPWLAALMLGLGVLLEWHSWHYGLFTITEPLYGLAFALVLCVALARERDSLYLLRPGHVVAAEPDPDDHAQGARAVRRPGRDVLQLQHHPLADQAGLRAPVRLRATWAWGA